MIIIGLTGSIGMGKSTVAGMFEKLGIPAHDADKAVHELMRPNGKAYNAIINAFPYERYPKIYKKSKNFFSAEKYLDRVEFGKIIFRDDNLRKKLESILHPLVREHQNKFIADSKRAGKNIVVLDIPLLFETDAHMSVDTTINVEAPNFLQKARVLARPNMTRDKFNDILHKQMPSLQKSLLADYVIKTGLNRADTFRQVQSVLKNIQLSRKSKYEVLEKGRIY